ncbi:ClpP/crotonase [Zopfia rhizophila CBS 207.26]|uniref:ClpP/crotonase n=1 Tax=Zopfia rhizophila CBS 207.26 TaxID=1314779 RepID=A0A6A6E298_9PEZI|nr:ClpP/crotonase [Zopfia rhizophila CBS 207.26]
MRFSSLRYQTLACALSTIVRALELPDYIGLKTSLNRSVLEVTLHNPNSPINLWNQDTQDGLVDLVGKLQQDNETKVVIFRSDIPRYFVAHLDLSIPNLAKFVPSFGNLIYNISALPQVTIGAVEGRARGAGNELLVALDMRFATKNDTLFGQPEVGSGLFPGGGGSQYLPGLIGRGLAMEYILSANDINATEAERIGWINKAFDKTADMDSYIDRLTSRLRLFPQSALSGAKDTINLRSAPTREDILHDTTTFVRQLADPVVGQISARTQKLVQNSSAFEVELNLGEIIPLLYDDDA